MPDTVGSHVARTVSGWPFPACGGEVDQLHPGRRGAVEDHRRAAGGEFVPVRVEQSRFEVRARRPAAPTGRAGSGSRGCRGGAASRPSGRSGTPANRSFAGSTTRATSVTNGRRCRCRAAVRWSRASGALSTSTGHGQRLGGQGVPLAGGAGDADHRLREPGQPHRAAGGRHLAREGERPLDAVRRDGDDQLPPPGVGERDVLRVERERAVVRRQRAAEVGVAHLEYVRVAQRRQAHHHLHRRAGQDRVRHHARARAVRPRARQAERRLLRLQVPRRGRAPAPAR